MTGWDETSTKTAYDAVADAYADHFTSTEPELALELAMVDHFTELLPRPRHTLDAGCGAGRMMPYLAARGCQVHGVDLSEGMIRRARRDHPEYPVTVASLSDLPFRDATFDGVFSWYSTIHNPDDDIPGILTEVRRVLRRSGLALLGFQTGNDTREVGDGYRRRGHDITLMRYSRQLPWMCDQLSAADLAAIATLERSATGNERDGQGVIVAQAQ